MKKILLTLGGIMLLSVLAYTYTFWSTGHAQQAEAQVDNIQAVPATVMQLQSERVKLYEELPGRIAPYKVAEIRPQVNGIITARLFEEGSKVKEGQQLYQIDMAPYQAAYDSAKANLAKAEANIKTVEAKNSRYKRLVKIDAVTKQEYDDITASLAQARADIAIAKAAMTTAKINLKYTKVYAPISGRISKSAVTEGALVTANQAQLLATITQLDPVYLDLMQSSTDLIHMRRALKGQEKIPVTIYLEGEDTAYEHQGIFQFSDVTVDQTTGSVQLRSLFPNPDSILLPGLFVHARINLGTVNTVLVPQKAAIRGADGNLSVWMVNKENKVMPKPISAEGAIGNKWLIKEGVQAGDVIVLEGFQKIAPGALISPIYANNTAKSLADVASAVQGGH
ncbi:MAG: efflux RND transporter periplasmic adaptor subunit [Candidatus Nitrosoglobus sp.]|jgi:membrane fusion protein (multidrug efflux system)